MYVFYLWLPHVIIFLSLCSPSGRRMRSKQELTVQGRQPIIPPLYRSTIPFHIPLNLDSWATFVWTLRDRKRLEERSSERCVIANV